MAKGNDFIKEIRRQVKEGDFYPVYLLTGDEGYLIQWARHSLMGALAREDDEMNVSRFVSDRVDVRKLWDLAMTFPFFSEKRVILLDGTGIMKTGKDDFAQLLKSLPSTTCMIIVEEDVDKRTSVYKWIKKNGYVVDAQKKNIKEKDLISYIGGWLKKEGKQIRQEDAAYLAALVGNDLFSLKMESDKLAAYTGERAVVEREDIDRIVSVRIENRIFELMDAVTAGDKSLVLQRYNELTMLREEPMRILYMVTRQYRILTIVYDMMKRRAGDDEIAKASGINRYFLPKTKSQVRGYDEQSLSACLKACLDTEERIKSGIEGDGAGLLALLVRLTEKEI